MRRLRQSLQRNEGETREVRAERPMPGAQGGHLPPHAIDKGEMKRKDHYEAHEMDHQEDKFEGMTNEDGTDHQEGELEGLTNEARDDKFVRHMYTIKAQREIFGTTNGGSHMRRRPRRATYRVVQGTRTEARGGRQPRAPNTGGRGASC